MNMLGNLRAHACITALILSLEATAASMYKLEEAAALTRVLLHCLVGSLAAYSTDLPQFESDTPEVLIALKQSSAKMKDTSATYCNERGMWL